MTPTGRARALTSTTPGTGTQVWLRTHLLLPPVLDPAAVTYATRGRSQRSIPAPPATPNSATGCRRRRRPGFAPAGRGVRIDGATAAEAQVRGGGRTDRRGARHLDRRRSPRRDRRCPGARPFRRWARRRSSVPAWCAGSGVGDRGAGTVRDQRTPRREPGHHERRRGPHAGTTGNDRSDRSWRGGRRGRPAPPGTEDRRGGPGVRRRPDGRPSPSSAGVGRTTPRSRTGGPGGRFPRSHRRGRRRTCRLPTRR